MPATETLPATGSLELATRLRCFGGEVVVFASGHPDAVRSGLAAARALALDAHARLTRFDPASELSRLNADPRAVVPVSPLLGRVAAAVGRAGAASGGLVDATCRGGGSWRDVRVVDGAVVRPPGVQLDGGGLVKGLVADEIGDLLDGLVDDWAVDCRGDLRVGGRIPRRRTIAVADPIDPDGVLHRFTRHTGAVATSGITRRRSADGHHLIDPRTGRPADTGVLQATALAPTGLEAEVRAKAALLAGPRDGWRHLAGGGVLVLADGTLQIREA